jgi:hypothetical protein
LDGTATASLDCASLPLVTWQSAAEIRPWFIFLLGCFRHIQQRNLGSIANFQIDRQNPDFQANFAL